MSAKEATLDLRGRRITRSSAPKAGSVWETRMNLDGSFKVFNAGNSPENGADAQMDKKSSDAPRSPAANGKRKTWKSESAGRSPVQIARQRSEPRKSLDHDPKKSPVSISKLRSLPLDVGELGGHNGKIDKSPPDGIEDSRSDEGVVVEDKKLVPTHSTEISLLLSPAVVKKQLPPKPSPTKTNPIQDHSPDPPRRHSILQSFVDLVMWRDVSKSAFIFGIGAFGIISSAYSKDLNISFISVISYLSLVYLAAIFIFRSLVRSRSTDMDGENKDCVGEDEAIWFVKLVLPYANEFLLKLRALFSGDPATTMKLAVLLFILARCGGLITIWKMAKLGFVLVFTVPKICSAYSSKLTAFGTFWIQRSRDAWESCSYKKTVAFAIFTLAWNLSSMVVRIWAVFMLFVAFKYYQQSLIKEEWANEEHDTSIGEQKLVPKSTPSLTRKQKKVC